MTQLLSLQQIPAVLITQSGFAPYGQLITPSAEGKPFDERDAILELSQGIPRFYIMRLFHRGRTFSRITRHELCTQCLGSLNGAEWFMVVCPPSDTDIPNIEQMKAFKIPGSCFIKLEMGTWHAGPHFDREIIDFYNLELSDTNIVDRTTYDFAVCQNIEFEIIDRVEDSL